MSLTKRITPLKWVLTDVPDPEAIAGLIETCDLPGQVVKVLVKRGIDTAETIQRFLRPQMTDLRDPYAMSNMREGIDRVTQAFCNNEKMVIYGDYDVDGITATTLLYMVLSKLGGNVEFYLPNRLVEGYGLSKDGIDQAKERGISLIITVDTGITAIEEVEYARSVGIDVVVTDHHEPGEEIPKAVAIINPKTDGERYPDELSGVGVAFKFAQAFNY